jgi:hypothetical protein
MLVILALLFFKRAVPLWISIIALYAGAVVVGWNAVRAWRQLPPSVERYRTIVANGGIALLLVALATLSLAADLLGLVDLTLQFRVLAFGVIGLFAAGGGCLIWAHQSIQAYGRYRPRQPDFEEDEAGNIPRPTDGP